MTTEIATRRPAAWGRSLAALASIALAAVCAAGGAVLWTSFWRRPAPEPCTLPVLPVPRPGDLLAWSPDSTQLLTANRNGEAWIIHLPDRSVRMLPRFSQTPWDAAWDAAGHPLLISRVRYPISKVVRFDAAADRWTPLPVQGADLTISSNGRWITGIRKSVETNGHPFSAGSVSLEVWDTSTGALLDQRPLPGTTAYAVEWSGPGELTASQQQAPPRKQFAFRMAAGSLQSVGAGTAAPGGKLHAEYVAVAIRGERLREQVRLVLRLGNAPTPAADWHLWLRERGKIVQDIPLRRKDEGRSTHGDYHTWKSASVSPDGRYVVARAADDTLRILELGRP